jgi:hypothetical protein
MEEGETLWEMKTIRSRVWVKVWDERELSYIRLGSRGRGLRYYVKQAPTSSIHSILAQTAIHVVSYYNYTLLLLIVPSHLNCPLSMSIYRSNSGS